MGEKIRVGITQGDSNGVGYEIIIKTLMDTRILEFCTPVVYGSSKAIGYYRKLLGIEQLGYQAVNAAGDLNPKTINVVNCVPDDLRIEPGRSTPEAAQAALLSLQTAVADIKQNKIDVLVTAPFNKQTMNNKAGFSFPGHTEFLAQSFDATEHLMLLLSDVMRIGVATGHIPLAEVPGALHTECILKKLQLLHQTLQRDFCISRPRIAVLGLNPHAGDGGLLGREEDDIISPAVAEAEKAGILAFGPYAADGFFGAASFQRFDAILAMYHDQGLSPFKALSFHSGVNYTAGLDIVRTSPVHGTGYDIVKTGAASPDSFREAIYAACNIFRCRKEYARLRQNPLKPIDPDQLPHS
jgi:4-hydroxythreonine-4-phosphate dehydrogenase